ncbi:hypothetical protein V6N13_009398 [Hibiscus sabdariffa]
MDQKGAGFYFRAGREPQGSLLDPFPSLPHCSSKCATLYEDLLPFCPLPVHTVLKAEKEGWAVGTMSPLSHTSIQKQVWFTGSTECSYLSTKIV